MECHFNDSRKINIKWLIGEAKSSDPGFIRMTLNKEFPYMED